MLHLVQALRVVDMTECCVARHQSKAVGDEGWQRLGQRRAHVLEHAFREPFDGPRVQPHVLHLLGGHVVRLHAHLREFHVARFLDVGMGKLIAVVVDGGPSEDNILGVDFVVAGDVLGTAEPHQVDHTRPVGHVGHDAFAAVSHLKLLETQNLSFYLHERHVARQFADLIDFRAVHIFIRVILQQVTKCVDAQFLAQYILPSGSYAWQVFDVLMKYVVHRVVGESV